MTRLATVLRRRIGPLDVTVLRVAVLAILAGVLFWSWHVNSRIVVFYCDTDTVAQGRPCLGIDEFVRWHTAIIAAAMVHFGVIFFLRVQIVVVSIFGAVFTASSAVILWLWISVYYRDIDFTFIHDSWWVHEDEGVLVNVILMIGILGYFALLVVEGRQKRWLR